MYLFFFLYFTVASHFPFRFIRPSTSLSRISIYFLSTGQHPRISRIVKEATKGIWHKKGIKAKLNIMSIMLNLEPWKNYNLSLHIYSPTPPLSSLGLPSSSSSSSTENDASTTNTNHHHGTSILTSVSPNTSKKVDIYQILSVGFPTPHRLPSSILTSITYGPIASMNMYTEALRLYNLISKQKNKTRNKVSVDTDDENGGIKILNDEEEEDNASIDTTTAPENNDEDNTDTEILQSQNKSKAKRKQRKQRKVPSSQPQSGKVISPKIHDISSSSSDEDDNESLDSLIELEIPNSKDMLLTSVSFSSVSRTPISSLVKASSSSSSLSNMPSKTDIILLIDDDTENRNTSSTKTSKSVGYQRSTKRTKYNNNNDDSTRSSSYSKERTSVSATLGLLTTGTVAYAAQSDDDNAEEDDDDDIISISDDDDDSENDENDDDFGLTQDNDENDDKLMNTQESVNYFEDSSRNNRIHGDDDIDLEYTKILPLRERLALRKALQKLSPPTEVTAVVSVKESIEGNGLDTVPSGSGIVNHPSPPKCTLCHSCTDDTDHTLTESHTFLNVGSLLGTRTPTAVTIYDSGEDEEIIIDGIENEKTTALTMTKPNHHHHPKSSSIQQFNPILHCPSCTTGFHLFCLSDYGIIYQSKHTDSTTTINNNDILGTSGTLLYTLVPSQDIRIPCPNQACSYRVGWTDWIGLVPNSISNLAVQSLVNFTSSTPGYRRGDTTESRRTGGSKKKDRRVHVRLSLL